MDVDLSIFVCYRRADTSGEAVALTDKLNRRRGFAVFKDVDNIRPGDDWLDAIEESMDQCDVLLVLIGPDWIGSPGDEGHSLDENDHVRREIEAAMARKKAVIPILFGDAELPTSQQLPESLRPLLRRQSLEIRNSTFNRDVEALVVQLRTIARHKQPPPPPPPPPPPEPPVRAEIPPKTLPAALLRRGTSPALVGSIAIVVVLVAAVGLMYAFKIGPFAPPPTATATPTTPATPSATAIATSPPPPTPTPTSAAVLALKANVPAAIVGTCTDQTGTSNAYVGSIASLACSATGVDGVYYDLYASEQALADFYASEVTKRAVTTSNETSCATGSLDIVYRFKFDSGATLSGPGYRLMCFKAGSNLAWLEQSNPADRMMITFRRADGDQAKLWEWWQTTATSIVASPSPSP